MRKNMLTYDLDRMEGPLYERLYKCIKNDVNNGVLRAGEKLPSKRSFAKNLGVSTITVENAYDQLISEGYVYAVAKKGYYAADISGIDRLPRPTLPGGISLPAAAPAYLYDLSGNHTDPANFPFSIWARLMRETISLKDRELMEKSPCGGVYPLRQAIAEHLRSFRGMTVDPDQIVVGAGTEYLYGRLIQLLGRDKVYCVENPGYKKIAQIYQSTGVICRYADLDSQGVTAAGLTAAGADIAHISPTHHFPTGITMPVNRRYELLAWANRQEGRYIIEDEYDSEFRLNGRPIPSLQSIDANGKVIYMNTFAKSLSSTVRISYMVLPVALVNKFYRELAFYSCTVSNFEQYALALFIKKGYFEKHINRMRLYYVRQRQKVLECIENSPLEERCSILERDSGLHFLLRLRTELSDEELSRRLAARGLHLAALSAYCHEPVRAEEHAFIFCYSNIDPDDLPRALEIIAECLD